MTVPVFPMPEFDQGRTSERNKEQLAEAARLIEGLKAQRADSYKEQIATWNGSTPRCSTRTGSSRGRGCVLPLGSVARLADGDDVQYLELADGVARPPADGNADNDLVDARAQIASDPYFNLGQTAGWIGLLDTGVRTTHVSFNAPDHIAITDDLSGDGDPTDQCNHGTASAGLITGNGRLGAAWRGVSAISLDSWDVYGDDCLVGGADTVEGFQEAVSWLDKVIVAEVQLNASETSASSTAADSCVRLRVGRRRGERQLRFGSRHGPVARQRPQGPRHRRRRRGERLADGRTPGADRPRTDATSPTWCSRRTWRPPGRAVTPRMGAFGGTSCATPVAGGAMGLLRNWMRGGVGSIDAGHVYSQAILGGQTTWPFNNDTGAGPFVLGTGGHAWWGKVNIGQSGQIDIPISVAAGKNLFEGSLWWPESTTRHNDVDLALVAPDGTVRDYSVSGVSVFERAGVPGVYRRRRGSCGSAASR